MHNVKKDKNVKTAASKRKSEEEVNDVVECLLEEVILMGDGGNKTKIVNDPSLEEMVIDTDDKKYSNVCDDCGLEFEANRKYLSVQLFLKHKDSCNGSINSLLRTSCTKCGFTAKENYILKRHMRDEHNIKTGSISPPMKKKKKPSTIDITIEEIKEVNDADENYEDELANLSSKIEDMDIDDTDCDEIKLLKERSDVMDKKIIEREKHIRDEEIKIEKKRKESEAKKLLENKIKLEISKKVKKKSKQIIKDDKENSN